MPLKRNATALEDLLAAPLISIGEAQAALLRSNVGHVTQFFETLDDGSYGARMLNICLRPPQGGDLVKFSVPLISLVTLPQLLIEDATVSMNSQVQYRSIPKREDSSLDEILPDEGAPAPRLHCKLMPATPRRGRQSGPGLKVSLKVASRPANEGIQRIQDRLTTVGVRGPSSTDKPS